MRTPLKYPAFPLEKHSFTRGKDDGDGFEKLCLEAKQVVTGKCMSYYLLFNYCCGKFVVSLQSKCAASYLDPGKKMQQIIWTKVKQGFSKRHFKQKANQNKF